MIILGDIVRDELTGFTGTATSRVEYLTGCTQYGVLPKMNSDGKFPDAVWIDELRLVVVGESEVKQSLEKKGGPNMPVRQSGQPPI